MSEDRLRVDLREAVRVLHHVQDYLVEELIDQDQYGTGPTQATKRLLGEVVAAIAMVGG